MALPETNALAAWKDLAMRAIDCLHDVERETDWGRSTFGPSVWDRLRDEQNELLAGISEQRGTFACRICGKDTPHSHNAVEAVAPPAKLLSTIAYALEPWAFDNSGWRATQARDESMGKAQAVLDALREVRVLRGDALSEQEGK